jgi:penicillin-binding protein 2
MRSLAMTELKNLEVELGRYRTRLWAAAGFVLFCLACCSHG